MTDPKPDFGSRTNCTVCFVDEFGGLHPCDDHDLNPKTAKEVVALDLAGELTRTGKCPTCGRSND